MSDTATVELLAGARAEPESLLEHHEVTELEEAEAVAMLGVSGDARVAAGEAWFGGSVLGWLYLPEGEASALRVVPAAGWVHGAEAHAHVDLAGRYAVEWAPSVPEVTGGRAEVTARAGSGVGVHRLEGWMAAVDHRFFTEPTWSFTTVEVGPQWRVEPGAFRWSVRGTGQGNWSDAGPGAQARLRVGGGYGRGAVDLDLAWQVLWATGGGADPAYRPPFDLLGGPDEDADALSGGGFVQHRVDLGGVVTGGPWTIAASAVGRLRRVEGGTDTTLHLGVDAGRRVGGSVAVHATVGANAWRLGGVDLVDPFGWLGLELSVRRE